MPGGERRYPKRSSSGLQASNTLNQCPDIPCRILVGPAAKLVVAAAGLKPTFFFAPSQIAKRNQEWGPGAVMLKAGEASANLSKRLRESITIEWTRDARGLQVLWSETLDSRVSPSRGQMVSL